MRFIGSKTLLLDHISEIIESNISQQQNSFCDIFSGTTVVSKFFKNKYQIISNDIMYFSYVLQNATVKNNLQPNFPGLKTIGINDPIKYINEFNVKIEDIKKEPFIYKNYSPNDFSDRKYFTNENALKIDFARQLIEQWKINKYINIDEYFYILASLIEAVPFVSNIAGTYGAYLKNWDKRAFLQLTLNNFDIDNNYKKNESYNTDSNELIYKIKGDILYIDPPYNSRQYVPNYHILETIAKYDSPNIYGTTGLRPYKDVKSDYCIKNRVINVFQNLIQNAKFKYIIVSYSTEGLMSENEIKSILLSVGEKDTLKIKKIPYRRYKHTKSTVNHNLNELLFFIKKS